MTDEEYLTKYQEEYGLLNETEKKIRSVMQT